MRHGYTDVLPRAYIEHLEDKYVPLDKQPIKEARKHYFRPRDHSGPKPGGIKKYSKRLDEEQEDMGRDDIAITNDEKFCQYLLQNYRSGRFSRSVIRKWKRKATADQTYLNAVTFFQKEEKGDREVDRLTGDAANADQYGSIQAALENGLDATVDKFNANVQDQINAAVATALATRREPVIAPEQANAIKTANDELEKEIKSLKDQVNYLKNE